MLLCLQLTRTGDIGKPFGNVFDYGAGHVDPPKALCPGLGKTDQLTSSVLVPLPDNGMSMHWRHAIN
jgi:hypothetical protein